MKKYSKNLKLISKYFLKYKGPIPCLLIKYMKLIEIYNLAKINKITNKTIDAPRYVILIKFLSIWNYIHPKYKYLLKL